MSWAFATVRVRQEEMLGAIAGRALVRLEEFNPQDLSNTAWAFATLGVRQEELLGAIAGRALVRLEESNPQNLANTACGSRSSTRRIWRTRRGPSPRWACGRRSCWVGSRGGRW